MKHQTHCQRYLEQKYWQNIQSKNTEKKTSRFLRFRRFRYDCRMAEWNRATAMKTKRKLHWCVRTTWLRPYITCRHSSSAHNDITDSTSVYWCAVYVCICRLNSQCFAQEALIHCYIDTAFPIYYGNAHCVYSSDVYRATISFTLCEAIECEFLWRIWRFRDQTKTVG